MLVGHRNVGPHAGWIAIVGAVGPLIDIAAPEYRPGHASDCQEHDEGSDENSSHGMKITPEHALAPGATDRHDTALGASFPLAWPPQKDTGADQQDRPAADYFNNSVGHRSEPGKAVQLPDHPHDRTLVRDVAKYSSCIGIDKNGNFIPTGFHSDLSRSFRIGRRQILHRSSRICGKCRIDQRRRRGTLGRLDLDVLEVAVNKIIDLVLVQIGSTRHR